MITYQSSRNFINLTPRQVAVLEAARVWPKDAYGEEYANVSHVPKKLVRECDEIADNLPKRMKV